MQRPAVRVRRAAPWAALCVLCALLPALGAAAGQSVATAHPVSAARPVAAAMPAAAVWLHDGRPTAQAAALVAQLQAAADYGLRADDYGAAALAQRLAGPGDLLAAPADAGVDLDSALSAAALRFAHDLHFGRIDARAAGFALQATRPPMDDAALLSRLAVSDDPAAEFAKLEPQFLHYQLLKNALRHYRELAQEPELTALPPLPARAVHVGDHYAGAEALRQLLVALGDLGLQPATPSDALVEVFDSELSAALQKFQQRHGLSVDGVLAGKSFAALTTPLQQRAHQLELTLERWRWLPVFATPPIIVNIPQFRLFAFRTTEDRAADIAQMPVIVGQAFRQKRTPVFVSELRYVVFRPYWDVPRSIVNNEMLAPMRADVRYLERNDLELVRGGGDDGTVVPPTAANIETLAAGGLRLRQRPGADNALGLVKFVMPNDYGVYLHSTPARQLFERARRDFSHGCIRVSDPVALAVHVLRGTDGNWNAAAVEQAMQGQDAQRVPLAEPVPVMVLYGTAMATEAGPVLFFDDIYGHDRRLDALLRARRP